MTDNTKPAVLAGTTGLESAEGIPIGVAMNKVPEAVNNALPVGAYMTEDHRYYFNREGPVPSVTTVLELLDKPALTTWKAKEAVKALYRQVTGNGFVNPQLDTEDDAVKYALGEVRKVRTDTGNVGTGIHYLADMVARGVESDSKRFQVSESTKPYLDAYRGFVERFGRSSFVSSEHMVWSLNGYAGTYDLLMMIDGQLWLLDLKTGKGLYPEFGLQLSGYRWADYIILPNNPTAVPMPSIDRTGVLHLRPDKYPDTGYRILEYETDYEKDFLPFLGLVELYRWTKEGRFNTGNLIPLTNT